MEASPTRAASAAVIKLFGTMDNVDPALVKAIEDGSYLVDPRAVAEAIVRRHEQLAEARRLSAMLVSAEVGNGAVGGVQPGNGSAGADVA
jgi:hypothetical protein